MVVFARLISYEEQCIQLGFGTTPLPLRYAMDVLDLKKDILENEKSLTPDTLLKYDDIVRDAYFVWAKSAYQLPQITNNDGDPIVLCTLYYKLSCSPKMVFDHLVPLCKGEKPKNLLMDGKFRNNELYSIRFPWIKNQSKDLILGDIKIEDNKLIICVNSVERSKKIQKEIKRRLPEAIFESEKVKPLNLKNLKQKSAAPSPPTVEEKTIIRMYLKKYYKEWLDSPLPALNGKTPRQTAKTDEGKERLEFLLLDFEMSNQHQSAHLEIDVQALRQELGLEPAFSVNEALIET